MVWVREGGGKGRLSRCAGGLEKRRDVRLLVGEKLPVILCLQETKLQLCDDLLSASVWGLSSHLYSFRPSVGASRAC